MPERNLGEKRERVIYTFTGRFAIESFLGFARHRAARLDLPLAVLSNDDSAISLAVEGQEDLLDAFEMACSLGPHDCLVRDVEAAPAPIALFEQRNERMGQ